MVDKYNRTIDYLRLSVTDHCNMNCCYCRPGGECFQREGRSDLLSFEEIYLLCECFSELGIRKIKVTGGEPLIRPGVLSLIKHIKHLPGIEQVTLTTNGLCLEESAKELAFMGIDGINVSLDSFLPDCFSKITGVKKGEEALDRILRGMKKAIQLGTPLKINTVLMRGENEKELDSFLQMAKTWPVSVRFIEMMPIGEGIRFQTISGEEILCRLRVLEDGIRACEKYLGNGPAVYYKAEGWKGQIGFIRAVTEPFCRSCNRIRMTADGKLRLCLAYEEGVDLQSMCREGKTKEEIKEVIQKAVLKKPAAHPFDQWKKEGRDEIGKNMWQIGG